MKRLVKRLVCTKCYDVIATFTGDIKGTKTWFPYCTECIYGVK